MHIINCLPPDSFKYRLQIKGSNRLVTISLCRCTQSGISWTYAFILVVRSNHDVDLASCGSVSKASRSTQACTCQEFSAHQMLCGPTLKGDEDTATLLLEQNVRNTWQRSHLTIAVKQIVVSGVTRKCRRARRDGHGVTRFFD